MPQLYNPLPGLPAGTPWINPLDISQGGLGDCWFMSALGELAMHSPDEISNMITANADGSCTVKLYNALAGGGVVYETVSSAIVNSLLQYYNGLTDANGNPLNWYHAQTPEGLYGTGTPELWVELVEYAAEQLPGFSGPMMNGGYPANALRALTGQAASQYNIIGMAATTLLSDLLSWTRVGKLVEFVSSGIEGSNQGGGTLVGDHAYMFDGLTTINGKAYAQFLNPWGLNYASDEPDDISLAQLVAGNYTNHFSYMDVGSVGSGNVITASPMVSGINFMASGNDLNAGNLITIAVTWNAPVIVSDPSVLSLGLNNGAKATYAGGSGNTLYFNYTVAAGDDTAALAVWEINEAGDPILSRYDLIGASGQEASTYISSTTQTGRPKIDTTITVPTITAATPKTVFNTATAIVPKNDELSLTGKAEAGSSVAIYDNGNYLDTVIANTSGVFSYVTGALAAGLNSFTEMATDAAGNASAMSGVNAQLTVASDPVVTGIGMSSAGGVDLNAGDVVTITLDMSTPVAVSGASAVKLALSDGGTATYVSGSGTDTLTFHYTVAAGQNTEFLQVSALLEYAGGVWHQYSVASATQTGGMQVDTSAPIAPTVTGMDAIAANQAMLAGMAEANSIVKVYNNGYAVGTAMADNNGAFSYGTGALAIGAHIFTEKATDMAGNVSGTSTDKAEFLVIGGAGTFSVSNTPGTEIISGFNTANDVLQFSHTLFASYAAAMSDASQAGADTVFNIDSKDSVTLLNVAKSALTANNLHIV